MIKQDMGALLKTNFPPVIVKSFFKLDECKVISSTLIAMGTGLKLSPPSKRVNDCLLQKTSNSIHKARKKLLHYNNTEKSVRHSTIDKWLDNCGYEWLVCALSYFWKGKFAWNFSIVSFTFKWWRAISRLEWGGCCHSCRSGHIIILTKYLLLAWKGNNLEVSRFWVMCQQKPKK